MLSFSTHTISIISTVLKLQLPVHNCIMSTFYSSNFSNLGAIFQEKAGDPES